MRPTVKDVADDAGVSLATVSLVLNGKVGVGPETRQRVQLAIERLGYRRRGLRLAVGLLIERLSVPATGDQRALRGCGTSVEEAQRRHRP